MTAPPVVKLFPAASFACSVTVVDEPVTTEANDTPTVDVATEIAPGVTVTVGIAVVTATPPIVALIVVAVPDVTPVNVAVYVPSE